MSDTTSKKTIDELFYRSITRNVNQVVTVDNDDPNVVKQELEEYVLTPQLERHFSNALEAVVDTEHAQTEEVGMWISGFFGSGKSHYMKILGYLLEDRKFENTSAAEVFCDRIESDKMLDGTVKSVSSKFDSEVLMFQIGAKSDATGDDSITGTVLREFNTERGYASTPWVAQMEQEMEDRGIFEDFTAAIRANRDDAWENTRHHTTFVRSAMATALTDVSDDFATEDQARQAIEDVENNLVINPSSLADQILDHVESREAQTGENCRYFVFIDEISQFIGDDDGRLLELQSIVEQFKQKGKGKIFLGVTSQEQLQELVPGILEKEDQESKVIDRFPHRYQLVSDNLDKVVRDRILRKNGSSIDQLGTLYDENDGILTARYKLDSSRTLKPVTRDNFIECYPFLPYQLDILPDIFAALRGEGSDDRLTGRERTLIDVTHSVLKDDEMLYGKELGQLVTLDMIFDEISDDVPDIDVSSIKTAEVGDTPEEKKTAHQVLKSLYLIQQLDWLANSAENIATTLQPEIGQTHQLETDVQNALDDLVDEGYVGRGEEGYRFLRETERNLETEIKGVKVRNGDIRRASKRYLRDTLDSASKINYSGQTFDLNITVDGEEITSNGHIDLNAYSPVQQFYESVEERSINTKSHGEEDTLYWIANDENGSSIRDKIKSIQQIDTVLKNKWGSDLSAEEQEAIGQKQEDLQRLRSEVEAELERSFKTGTIIYHGTVNELDDTDKSLSSHVTSPATDAVKRVFTKLDHGLANVKDRHLEQIFGDLTGSSNPTVFSELGVVKDGEIIAEARVASDVADEIIRREKSGEDRMGSDLIDHFAQPPYGWTRDVVRLAAAVLFRNGSIIPTYKERTYGGYTEDGAQELFTQVSKFKQTSFDERETVDPQTRTEAKNLLNRLFDRKVKSTDQAIDEAIRDEGSTWASRTSTLTPQLTRLEFPLSEEVEEFNTLLNNILGQATSAKRIKQFVDLEDELEDLTRTVKSVDEFCGGETGEGHLDEYETIQRFITTEWADLLDEANSNAELIDIDDAAKEAAERIQKTLDTKGVIDGWTDVTTDYRTAANEFLATYEDLYEHRHEVYTEAVEQVRSYADDEIDESDLESALTDLSGRQGSKSIDLEIEDRDHIGPNPTVTRLIEHIQTIDSYKQRTIEAVDKLTIDDKTVRKYVDLQSIFGGEVVQSVEDLDAPVSELREEISELLDTDDDVEIRFR